MKHCLLAIALVFPLTGADFHLSPAGGGEKTGADARNAAPAIMIGEVFNEKMASGDTLRLAAGKYHDLSVTLEKGGAEEAKKTITGPEDPMTPAIWTSSWTIEKPDEGPTAVTLAPGLSHVAITNLEFKGYQRMILAKESTKAPRDGLLFRNLKMSFMRHGFYLSDCDEVRLEKCLLVFYSKHGFRFEEGCDGVEVIDCLADCSNGAADWESRTELFPFGFTVNNGGAPNTELSFVDCVARNNVKSNQNSGYPNGDGFVVEGNTKGITFLRCHSVRATDAGFDLKPEATLIDCFAAGNHRDFRLWSTGDLANCVSAASSTGLWCNGGPVTATRCTFYKNTETAAMTDDKATKSVILRDCLIVPSEEKGYEPTRRLVEKEGTVVSTEADLANPEGDPARGPVSFDSKAFPDKGAQLALEKPEQ